MVIKSLEIETDHNMELKLLPYMSAFPLLHGRNESVGVGSVQTKYVSLPVTVAFTAAWSSEEFE